MTPSGLTEIRCQKGALWDAYIAPTSGTLLVAYGKARQAFDAVSRLPRRQQDQIIKVVNALVAQHATAKAA